MSTLEVTLFPYTPRFRSQAAARARVRRRPGRAARARRRGRVPAASRQRADGRRSARRRRGAHRSAVPSGTGTAPGPRSGQNGRANVWTPVTNAQLVCRLLLEKKKKKNQTERDQERQQYAITD